MPGLTRPMCVYNAFVQPEKDSTLKLYFVFETSPNGNLKKRQKCRITTDKFRLCSILFCSIALFILISVKFLQYVILWAANTCERVAADVMSQ